jgi:GntR family transcriptional regulator
MLVTIVTNTDIPIFQQIVGQMKQAIAKGKLEMGEKLPSIRELSEELSINPNTVQKAYSELERSGVIETRKGLGAFVCKTNRKFSDVEIKERLNSHIKNIVAEAKIAGCNKEKVITWLIEGFESNE